MREVGQRAGGGEFVPDHRYGGGGGIASASSDAAYLGLAAGVEDRLGRGRVCLLVESHLHRPGRRRRGGLLRLAYQQSPPVTRSPPASTMTSESRENLVGWPCRLGPGP